MRPLLLAILLVTTSCNRELTLPPPPVGGIVVASLSIDRGFAGDEVILAGRGFGAETHEARVTFGGSSPQTPTEIADDRLVVVVPADATTGPIVVESPLGRASTPTFTFEGAGTPRLKRIAVDRDLRPLCATAFPMGNRIFVADTAFYDQAALLADVPFNLGLRNVVEAVRHPDGGALVLDGDATDTAGCEGHITRIDANGDVVSTITLQQPHEDCTRFNALAVGFDGRFAAALATELVAIVDLEEKTVTTLMTGQWPESIAATGNDRFIAGATFGVLRIARDDGTWTVSEPAIVTDDETDFSEAVAGRPDGVGAVLTDTGKLVLIDTAVWPPEPIVQGGFPWQRTQTGRLALSADGQRLAVSLFDLDRVTTFDVADGTLLPLGSIEVDAPQRIEEDGSLFFVGTRGAMVAVAQKTGALVDAFAVKAALGWPVLRQTDAGLVVEVGSSLFERVLRLEPNSLQFLEPDWRYEVPNGKRMLSLTATGDALFVSRVGEVQMLAGEGREEGVAFHTTPEDEQTVEAIPSTDGRLLLVVTGSRDTVLSLVATAPWTGDLLASMPTPGLFRPAADGQFLTLLYYGHLEVYDLAALLAGAAPSVAKVREVHLPDDLHAEYGDGALVRGRLVFGVVREGGDERNLVTFEPATGTLTIGDLLHRDPANDPMILSPSGRHVFWTEFGENGRRVMDSQVDPLTGAVLGTRPPLLIDGGTAGLAVAPDGEHLFIVEQEMDRLLLIE